MTESQYLRLKIMSLEFQQVCAKAENIVHTARAKYNESLLRAGLDPNVTYVMDDTNFTATPVDTQPAKEQ